MTDNGNDGNDGDDGNDNVFVVRQRYEHSSFFFVAVFPSWMAAYFHVCKMVGSLNILAEPRRILLGDVLWESGRSMILIDECSIGQVYRSP